MCCSSRPEEAETDPSSRLNGQPAWSVQTSGTCLKIKGTVPQLQHLRLSSGLCISDIWPLTSQGHIHTNTRVHTNGIQDDHRITKHYKIDPKIVSIGKGSGKRCVGSPNPLGTDTSVSVPFAGFRKQLQKFSSKRKTKSPPTRMSVCIGQSQ